MYRNEDSSCFICRKHVGREETPPGGYIFEGEYFRVCHAPLDMATSGTLIVESRRHFLDYSEMTDAEARELFETLRKLFPLMKKTSDAPRIYSFATMEYSPHFHLWLVPRKQDSKLRGTEYLAAKETSSKEDAEEAAEQIRASLKSTNSSFQ